MDVIVCSAGQIFKPLFLNNVLIIAVLMGKTIRKMCISITPGCKANNTFNKTLVKHQNMRWSSVAEKFLLQFVY